MPTPYDGVVLDQGGAVYNIDSMAYGDLADLIEKIGLAGGGVAYLPPGTYPVGEDLTIPSHISLRCAPGAIITPAAGKTVTIAGPLEVGLYQIFDTSAGGSIAVTGPVREVYPQWWGAWADGSADATSQIRSAIATNKPAVVTPGTYRVDGTIAITVGEHLILTCGAKLERVAGAASTDSIIHIIGNHARLSGEGTIMSGKPSPKGVVRVGHTDETKTTTINWTSIEGIRIAGVKATGNIGLDFYSDEPSTGVGSNFNGRFSNITIDNCGTGLHMSRWCNAHTFSSIFFYNIADYCYHIDGCQENTFLGGFTHFSNGATIIRLENDCLFQCFYGVQAEPGGAASYYEIDQAAVQCQIIGHGNTAGSDIDNSGDTVVINKGRAKLPRLATTHKNFTQSSPGGITSYTELVHHFSDKTKNRVKIADLRRDTWHGYRSGAFYEITIAGFRRDDFNVKTFYEGKWLVTPYNMTNNDYHVRLLPVFEPNNITATPDDADQSVTFEFSGFNSSHTTVGDIAIEVRKVGLGVADATLTEL